MKCTAIFSFVSAVVAVASSPVPLSDLLVEGECDKEECDATAMLQHKRSGVHELDGDEQEDATSRRRKCKQGHFGRPCKQFHGTGSAGGSKTAAKTGGSKTVAKTTAPSVGIAATSTKGPHTASSASTTVAPPATQVWRITATSTKGPHTAGVPATLASSASTTVAPPTAQVPTQITATSTRAPHTAGVPATSTSSASTTMASKTTQATATTVQLPAACTSGMVAPVAKAMTRCFELCPTLCEPLSTMINDIYTAKLVGAAVPSAHDAVCKNKDAFMCAVQDENMHYRTCQHLSEQVRPLLGIELPKTDDELNKECP